MIRTIEDWQQLAASGRLQLHMLAALAQFSYSTMSRQTSETANKLLNMTAR
jgi:DNA invertase Pin-like site-specific DNA recombinase